MNKVLIIDDEEDFLLVLKKRLTSEGYSVVTATNGVDAIGLALLDPPDIIILDVLMPEMDGGQVLEELKDYSATRNIPVILLTALFTKAEEKKYGSMSGDYIAIAKPPDTGKLLEQMKKLLNTTSVL